MNLWSSPVGILECRAQEQEKPETHMVVRSARGRSEPNLVVRWSVWKVLGGFGRFGEKKLCRWPC